MATRSAGICEGPSSRPLGLGSWKFADARVLAAGSGPYRWCRDGLRGPQWGVVRAGWRLL